MLIRARTEIPEANTVASGTLKRWHERLGHVNTRTPNKLISKQLVDCGKLRNSEEFFCVRVVFMQNSTS